MKKDFLFKELYSILQSYFTDIKKLDILSIDDNGIGSFELTLSSPKYNLSCIKFNSFTYTVVRVSMDKGVVWKFIRNDLLKENGECKILYIPGSSIREFSEDDFLTFIQNNIKCYR